MRFVPTIMKALNFAAALHLSAAQTLSNPDNVFNTTYLFTAKVLLGPPPPSIETDPITVPGGIIIPEAIIGGTVKGPIINGNITGGLATPRVYRNGTLQEPVIDIYGITDEGVPLTLHETGIGSPKAQVTRIEISIGGGEQYDVLRSGFILASVNPNAKRTTVTVEGYLVENIA